MAKKKKEKTKFSNICVDQCCPECGGVNYERDNYEDDAELAWFPCRCNDCGAKFDEVFRFAYVSGRNAIRGSIVLEEV